MQSRRRRWMRVLGRAGLALLLVLLVFPYLMPLSFPAAAQAAPPFDNSAFHVVNGVRFHYRVFRPDTEPVQGKLLLVHGLAGSTFSFEALAPLVQRAGYLVLAVDLPGFGYSERSLAYDHRQTNRARDLLALLSTLDQEQPAALAAQPWHLAGHSMGGGTVVAMALQAPARTRSLTLIDAPLQGDARRGLWMRFPPFTQWLQVALEHFLISEGNIKSLLTSAYGVEPSPAQVEGYLTPLRLPGTARSLARMFNSTEEETVQALQALTAPTLAIWGERDTWVPVSELEKLKALIPGLSAHIMEGAGHCPMETHTDAFAEVLLGWLAAH